MPAERVPGQSIDQMLGVLLVCYVIKSESWRAGEEEGKEGEGDGCEEGRNLRGNILIRQISCILSIRRCGYKSNNTIIENGNVTYCVAVVIGEVKYTIITNQIRISGRVGKYVPALFICHSTLWFLKSEIGILEGRTGCHTFRVAVHIDDGC